VLWPYHLLVYLEIKIKYWVLCKTNYKIGNQVRRTDNKNVTIVNVKKKLMHKIGILGMHAWSTMHPLSLFQGTGRMIDRHLLLVYVATGAVLFAFFVTDYGRGSGEDLGRRLSETYHHHKDLFPMDSSDFWGTLTVTLGLLVAAAGGIGGGGILVPLLILIFNFSPKFAVPLSNFTIVGSSITNMVLNIPKRHPECDRPLVDWDLILVMEPLTMAGAVSVSHFHIVTLIPSVY